VKFFIAATIAG
ncbi:hypothetical protein D043_2029B, partial [Vibrio parahaemolyticus EKP-021]